MHWDPIPLCVFAALSVGGVPLAPLRASPSAAAALGVSVALCATDGNQNNWEGRARSTVFS